MRISRIWGLEGRNVAEFFEISRTHVYQPENKKKYIFIIVFGLKTTYFSIL